MSTPNTMIDALDEAARLLKINSGALALIGHELGQYDPNLLSVLGIGIDANATLINKINEIIAEYYKDDEVR